MIKYLHETVPATLQAIDIDGMSPAHHAADKGHSEALHCLASIAPLTMRATDADGWMPSHQAASQGHVAVLRCLQTVAADTLSALDHDGATPLDVAKDEQGEDSEVAAFLKSIGGK